MANPKYAVSDKPVPVAELVGTLSDGTKVKRAAVRTSGGDRASVKLQLPDCPPQP